MDVNREELTLLRRELTELLEADHERLCERLADVHAADIADWMEDLEADEARLVFGLLPVEDRAEVLEEAEGPLREVLVEELPTEALREIVEELPADEGVDLLSLVDDERSAAVLDVVDHERAKDLRELGAHAHDTAGGQMTTEFTVAQAGMRIGDLIKEIKSEEDAEELSGSFVIDEKGCPVGYVPDRSLLTNSIHDVVDEVMIRPFTVRVDEDQEEAANIIYRYSLETLAVVDFDGRLVGILDAEDAQDVLEEEATEDLMRIVGASDQTHQTRMPILKRVRHRLPLQALTVLGGIATAFLLDVLLKKQAGDAVALLRFIPIVIGLAGNVGIQASTILVRAFATGEVEPEREKSVLISEVATGLIIGLLCGSVTLPVAAYMQGSTLVAGLPFGSAVGIAITAAVTWAAFLGCAVPMTCRRWGIDPAVVAGPFLITLSDISGTAIFVGGAKLLLSTV